MQQNNIILSVMVISHNQVHLIGRCLKSILRQRIRVPWEIVISDDASTDGTWEWIQEFARQEHEPEVVISQINSSDYDPTVTSDRCAANKANVYSHARGKYCVNIDADDYLLGNDIYQYQIDQLEAHPECTMALQNIWYQNDGEPVENGHSWHCKGVLKENEIITLQDYCQRRMFTSNPAFMMRRDPDLNPMEKYGLLFDDNIISMHHIVRGNIICSTKAQYVYVQYKNSIWNQVTQYPDDAVMRNMSVLLTYNLFFPKMINWIAYSCLPEWVRGLKFIAHKHRIEVSPLTKAYLRRYNCGLVNDILNEKISFLRVKICLDYVRFLSKLNLKKLIYYRIMFRIIG